MGYEEVYKQTPSYDDDQLSHVLIHIDGRSHPLEKPNNGEDGLIPNPRKGLNFKDFGIHCTDYIRWYLKTQHKFVDARIGVAPTGRSYEEWEYRKTQSKPLSIRHLVDSLHSWAQTYDYFETERYCLFFLLRYNNQSAMVAYDPHNYVVGKLKVPQFYHCDSEQNILLEWLLQFNNSTNGNQRRVTLPPPAESILQDLETTQRQLHTSLANLAIACAARDTARSELSMARNELDRAHANLDTTRSDLTAVRDEFDDTRRQADRGLNSVFTGFGTMKSQLTTLLGRLRVGVEENPEIPDNQGNIGLVHDILVALRSAEEGLRDVAALLKPNDEVEPEHSEPEN